MAQVNRPAVRPTGIPWLDALMTDPTAAVPGPAMLANPVNYVPMGQSMPAWLQPMVQQLLRRSAGKMPGQPALGLVGKQVSPAGMVGAAVGAEPQLLTAADRLRPFVRPQAAPLTTAAGDMPSDPLKALMAQIQQALSLSGRN